MLGQLSFERLVMYSIGLCKYRCASATRLEVLDSSSESQSTSLSFRDSYSAMVGKG